MGRSVGQRHARGKPRRGYARRGSRDPRAYGDAHRARTNAGSAGPSYERRAPSRATVLLAGNGRQIEGKQRIIVEGGYGAPRLRARSYRHTRIMHTTKESNRTRQLHITPPVNNRDGPGSRLGRTTSSWFGRPARPGTYPRPRSPNQPPRDGSRADPEAEFSRHPQSRCRGTPNPAGTNTKRGITKRGAGRFPLFGVGFRTPCFARKIDGTMRPGQRLLNKVR